MINFLFNFKLFKNFKVKDKRLKIDCLDLQEESKQIKTHNEQIKNASRLMYNFQNQLKQLDNELNKPDKVIDNDQEKVLFLFINNNELKLFNFYY